MTKTAVVLTIQPGPPCADNPELWFSSRTEDQSLAVHNCRTHCPLAHRVRCALDARRYPSTEAVQNGVLYDTYGYPVRRQPPALIRNCVTCGGQAMAEVDRQRRPAVTRAECGTATGWRMHDYRSEEKCPPCKTAYAIYQADKRDRNRAERGPVAEMTRSDEILERARERAAAERRERQDGAA